MLFYFRVIVPTPFVDPSAERDQRGDRDAFLHCIYTFVQYIHLASSSQDRSSTTETTGSSIDLEHRNFKWFAITQKRGTRSKAEHVRLGPGQLSSRAD